MFKRKKENKYHLTVTVNHFLQTELSSSACQCLFLSTAQFVVGFTPVAKLAFEWQPDALAPTEFCAQEELEMSIPHVTPSACTHAWGLMCLCACSICQERRPAKPRRWSHKSIRLSLNQKYCYTEKLVWVFCFVFFSFEGGFSAITGNKDLFASNKYLAD